MEEKLPPNEKDKKAEEREKKPPEELGLGLWRLLTTPEELIEETPSVPVKVPEKELVEEFPSDVDEAVIRFQEQSLTAIQCKNHPERPAVSECPECASYYCSECMIIKRGKLLCKTCAETLFPVTEEMVLEKIASGETDEQSLEFLADAPPQFNPVGLGEGSEAAISNPIKRIFAFLLDILFLRIFYIVSFIILLTLIHGISAGQVPSVISLGKGSFWNGVGIILNNIVHFKPLPILLLLDFLYFFVCYAIVNRTLGMSWFNLRIVTIYGDFVGLSSSAVRALILVMTFGACIIVSLFHTRQMGLHDIISQTYEINFSGLKRVDAYETINLRL